MKKPTKGSELGWAQAREQMVDVLVSRGIKDSRILAAMSKVPRHLFIPGPHRFYPQAYGDHPSPIGYGQTISQPYIVAYMTELLKVEPGEKVLEIGTGSGYQAAILAELEAEVYSIEIVPELARHARLALDSADYESVRVLAGDGYRGWPDQAPFDLIIVTCAPGQIPPELVEQLREGGRMVLPLGEGIQQLIILRKQQGEIKIEADLPVRFVPMVHGDKAVSPREL